MVCGWINRGIGAVQAAGPAGLLALAAILCDTRAATAERGTRIALSLPLDCAREACFLQNMVDRVSGPGRQDGWCGNATFDGHKGTDIRVADLPAMRRGVDVLAPAPGRVVRVRDGIADRLVRTPAEREAVRDRECGNGLVIDHGGGWTTQLCHLARGSLRVEAGERVTRSQPLGRVGLSGMTTFPHVHLALRRGKRLIDPMTGREAERACLEGRPPGRGLWDDAARTVLAPGPERIVAAGFAGGPVNAGQLMEGRVPAPRAGGPLVVFVQAINMARGDRLVLRLVSPDGEAREATGRPLERHQASYTAFHGLRRAGPGRWTGRVDWLRGERIVATREGLAIELD